MIYYSTQKYVGEFKDGRRHGHGRMAYPDGRVDTGEFKQGKRTGHGTMTVPDGRIISGRHLKINHQKKLQIMKASTISIKWSLTGALFGYFIFHPLVHIISVFHFFSGHSGPINFVAEVLNSFSVSMLPWSLAFIILNALIGLFGGTIMQANAEKSKAIADLQEALAKVQILSGFLPICSSCKKVRDDRGYWNQIEAYISEHSEAEFSHGICPECAGIMYSDIYIKD
jgi:hypothetical protein